MLFKKCFNSKSWNPNFFLFKIHQCSSIVKCFVAFPPLDKDESLEVFVGDVTSYTLHNLLPGTTYDVQVFAQYDGGISKPLTGQGTTCTFSEVCLACLVLSHCFQCQQDSQFECNISILSFQCTSMWPTLRHMTLAMTGSALNGRLTVPPRLTESSWILWTVSHAYVELLFPSALSQHWSVSKPIVSCPSRQHVATFHYIYTTIQKWWFFLHW